MNFSVPLNTQKTAERLTRLVMIVTLATASASKFFSHGKFADYYSGVFAADTLRIHLPPAMVYAYLQAIPFIELAVAVALAITRFKPYSVYAWFAFFLSLEVGHYVMEQWSEVNQMIPYFLLGLACLLLPHHRSWFRSDRD
jgi:hypothetical protein